MKTKAIKLVLALFSLLIGFAIVHSLSPVKESSLTVTRPVAAQFEFKNDKEIALECVYGNAPYEVHFSAYLQGSLESKEGGFPRALCHKLPSLGVTKITLDFMASSLRDKPVSLKFIHHDDPMPSAEALASAAIIGESFHKAIPRGLIQSRLDFSTAGFYTLLVEFGGDVDELEKTVTIPFQVGTEL